MRHQPAGENPELRSAFTRIIQALPEIVAEALDCSDPGGNLISEDVEVIEAEFGPQDIASGFDLGITIEAKDFPLRRASLQERTQQIRNSVAELPLGVTLKFYVWIQLMPAAFAKGKTA